MRKVIALFIALIFILSNVAWTITPAQKKTAQRAAKLKKEQLKLEQKQLMLKKQLMKKEEELERLREERKPEGVPEPEGLPRMGPPLKPMPMPMGPKPPVEKPRPRFVSPLEFGISLGLLANIPGAYLELRWHNPLDLDYVSAKTGVMYAQGKDSAGTERKHALLFVDGIYKMNPFAGEGVGTYIGGGLNYLVLTTGRVAGSIGAEAYLGLESRVGRAEVMYVELGYGAIRTGFSPSYKGLNATVGYRTRM
jgi:hypothetical protein